MKRLLLFALISSVITSCTLTTYTGELINPPTVEFNKPNFRYIKTIYGVSSATYSGFWRTNKSKILRGQFNEAKKNMYKQHQFRPNQIITNMTRDVVRTTRNKGWGRYEINIVLSGDIYEFYNGDPSRFKNPNITDDEQETSNLEKEVEVKTEFDISYFLKKGFSKYEDDLVLSEGAEIIFKLGSDLYKGKIEQFNQEFNLCNLVDVKKFDFKTAS